MTYFRPCIDLHQGHVKQIVGATLTDAGDRITTNFVSTRSAAWYADQYRRDGLMGGHLIMLGPGNEEAARAALAAFPGGLQIGGGITVENAPELLTAGASHIIVTSWLFSPNGAFLPERLAALRATIGRERLVIDLSCRRHDQGWRVAMNRWQTLTNLALTPATLDRLAGDCAEFLIHAADVEGTQTGMDESLIRLLGAWGQCPITYAGGASDLTDLARCAELSQGRVDLTIGSALDLFGGTGARYVDCLAWNRQQREADRSGSGRPTS